MTRIWFNRTYATNSHVIAMLRANPDARPVHVVASHTDPDSPVLLAADHAVPEPDDLDGEEYVSWALDFARAHGIEVFVPRLHLAELAEHHADFAAAGVALLAAPGATVRLFEDKAAAYAAAAHLGLAVPPHHVVTDSEGLRVAYASLREIAQTVCMKPVTGVGGDGYRVLTTGVPDLADYLGPAHADVDLDRVCASIDAAQALGRDVPPLLVMPYLEGPEISVDALTAPDGSTLAAIGRSRSRRRRLLIDDPGARHVAEVLNRAHRVTYLSNTQVRYWRGHGDAEPRPYLLELNTRISGGLFQTALAGVNLPWAAVRLALGEDVAALHPTYGAAFTTLPALLALPDAAG